jgi:hypothetical protein
VVDVQSLVGCSCNDLEWRIRCLHCQKVVEW